MCLLYTRCTVFGVLGDVLCSGCDGSMLMGDLGDVLCMGNLRLCIVYPMYWACTQSTGSTVMDSI